jgi:hypothetical protein
MTTLRDIAEHWGRLAARHRDDDTALWAAIARRVRTRCGGLSARTHQSLQRQLWRTFSRTGRREAA